MVNLFESTYQDRQSSNQLLPRGTCRFCPSERYVIASRNRPRRIWFSCQPIRNLFIILFYLPNKILTKWINSTNVAYATALKINPLGWTSTAQEAEMLSYRASSFLGLEDIGNFITKQIVGDSLQQTLWPPPPLKRKIIYLSLIFAILWPFLERLRYGSNTFLCNMRIRIDIKKESNDL